MMKKLSIRALETIKTTAVVDPTGRAVTGLLPAV